MYSIKNFLDYLTYQKRYSRHTIISYENDLRAFFDYITIQFDGPAIDEISSSIVRSWLASLKEQAISSKTINRKISSLKSYFKYELRLGHIASTPMTVISSLKVNKRLPSFIAQKDIQLLLREVEFPGTWMGMTDHLLLQIFYNTGVRLSELINLKESQVDTGNNSLKVLGKGGKERIVPLHNHLLGLINNYIREKARNNNTHGSEFLLVNDKGTKLYPKYAYRVVRKYLGTVSTNERKSPHILRHSFATHLTNNGADINAVKELLGHSSLASTQVYTHNSIDRLKDIYKLSHPKS